MVHENYQNLDKSIGLAFESPQGKPRLEEMKRLKWTFFSALAKPFPEGMPGKSFSLGGRHSLNPRKGTETLDAQTPREIPMQVAIH